MCPRVPEGPGCPHWPLGLWQEDGLRALEAREQLLFQRPVQSKAAVRLERAGGWASCRSAADQGVGVGVGGQSGEISFDSVVRGDALPGWSRRRGVRWRVPPHHVACQLQAGKSTCAKGERRTSCGPARQPRAARAAGSRSRGRGPSRGQESWLFLVWMEPGLLPVLVPETGV